MSARANAATRLGQTALFAGLAPDVLDMLAAQAVTERWPRGALLFQSGDTADGLRVVEGGLLRVWVSSAEGREITLTLLEPGDALGEIALLDGAPRSASVTAMDAATTLLIRRPAFLAVMETDPAIGRHIIALLCERLRLSTDHVGSIALLPLRRRVAAKLHQLAQSHAVPDGKGARFCRRFSQAELADMLGVTREAVNKQIATLVADGLISLQRGMLHITDLDALSGGQDPD